MTNEPTVEYDHHAPSFVDDHRDVHRRLRGTCPVSWSTTYGGFWVLSTYETVNRAAHEDAVFSSAVNQLIPPNDIERLLPIQVDPPEVRRFRALISPYLTPRALAGQLPAIEDDVARAVAAIVERGHGELVGELCNPIPARATMRLMGLDPDDWAVFGDPLHQATFATPGSDEYLQGITAINGFTEIIENEVDARYAEPRDDLVTDLTTSEYEGVATTRQEVIDLVRMLVFGGMDTVMAALSNIFAILAVRDDLRRYLVEDPSRIGRAIEEFLRFEAPIQGFAREVMSDTEVGGCPVAKGDTVWLTWGSANHDETVFADPDELDLARVPNRHLTFGVGEHRCMGSSLARFEMRIALTRFLAAAPEFGLTGPGVVHPATIGQILGKKAVHVSISR